jgi:anthranilate phosphoribosyltransferase
VTYTDTIAKVAAIEKHSIQVAAESGAEPEVLTKIAHTEAEMMETALLSGENPKQIGFEAESEAHAMEDVESPAELDMLIRAADIAHSIAIHTIVSEQSVILTDGTSNENTVHRTIQVALLTAVCVAAVGLAFVVHSRRAALAVMDIQNLRDVIGAGGRPRQQTPRPESTVVQTSQVVTLSTMELV